MVVPEGLDADEVEVVGEPARVAADGDGIRLQVDADERPRLLLLTMYGQFSADGLAPGAADVLLYLDDSLGARVDGIEVRQEEVNRDPRLQGIVLDLPRRVYQVRVVDGKGSPVPEASVGWKSADESDYRDSTQTVVEGLARVVAPGEGPHVGVVTHPGYRSSLRVDLAEEVKIVLSPGLGAEIVVHEPPRLPELPEGLALAARASLVADLNGGKEVSSYGDPRNRELTAVDSDEDGVARLEIRDPGIYEVQFIVRSTRNRQHDEAVGLGQPRARLRVEKPSQVLGSQFGIDPTDIEQVLDRVSR